MAVGPVQLLVLGFDHPDFEGEVIKELEKLRESDTIRVIDSLAVYKDACPGECGVSATWVRARSTKRRPRRLYSGLSSQSSAR